LGITSRHLLPQHLPNPALSSDLYLRSLILHFKARALLTNVLPYCFGLVTQLLYFVDTYG
jgi:hypothetical protein